MRKIEFTITERFILLHRACLHDCLGEVFADTQFCAIVDYGGTVTDEKIDKWKADATAAAARIEKLIKTGEIDLDALTEEELFVLQDCMDGSTYFADADSEGEWGTVASHRQAAQRLVEKFAAHGVKVTVPQA